jgi:hypothetical protein
MDEKAAGGVVLRRPLRQSRAVKAEGEKKKGKAAKQLSLDLPEATHLGVLYEYAVLVTSMPRRSTHDRATLSRSGGFGEQLRRVEEPVVMGGVHHARPQAMPNHGAHHGLDLQLVDHLHALGNPGQACGSDNLASIGLAWDSATDSSQQSNHAGDHQHACQGQD